MADLQGSALMRSILNAQPTPKTSDNSPAASPQGRVGWGVPRNGRLAGGDQRSASRFARTPHLNPPLRGGGALRSAGLTRGWQSDHAWQSCWLGSSLDAQQRRQVVDRRERLE